MFNENNSGWLYKKNKQGKVLIWTAYGQGFMYDTINIQYGQYGGKLQTEITKIEPKANRSPIEQFELEISSLYNKQRDKGYKSSKDLGIILAVHEEGDEYYTTNIEGDKRKWGTEIEAIEALLPNELTDAKGNLKPMKCTPYEGNAIKKVKFPCYIQPKLDGVRCFIMHNGERWIALSSSGKSYNVATRYILHAIEQANIDKNIILDGELYIHGTPLQTISGWCRKQTPIPEHSKLEFHLFDIADNTLTFEERFNIATEIHNKWLEHFINYKQLVDLVKLVYCNIIEKEETVKETHDFYVSEGYEGCIIRNANLGYEFGRRSTNIFKLKDFKDEEFEIIGLELGKRGTEDLVFELVTENGQRFKANPIGTREQKRYWFEHPSSYIHKRGTVRYLTLSNDGLPQGNPVLKAIRDYE